MYLLDTARKKYVFPTHIQNVNKVLMTRLFSLVRHWPVIKQLTSFVDLLHFKPFKVFVIYPSGYFKIFLFLFDYTTK